MLRYSYRSIHQWLWAHRPPKKWVVGVAAGLPLLAVVQGSILLSDFRERHSDSPKPHTPSKGVVIAVSHDDKARGVSTALFHEARRLFLQNSFARTAAPPLRVLVIGDSLAAGVGVSDTATPVLPEAIARTLSMHLDGRVVHYTCVGTPGASAATIVRLIETYTKERSLIVRQPTIPPEIIITEGWIHGWENFWHRMGGKKDRLHTWWHQLREKLASPSNGNNSSSTSTDETTTAPRRQKIVVWWRHLQNHVRALPQAWEEPRKVNHTDVSKEEDEHDNWQKWQLSLQRRSSLQNPEIVGEFDVAVVLTGLNDLKEATLPFMFRNRRPKVENEGSLRVELERVLQALQERMALVLDRSAPSQKQDAREYVLDCDEENVEAELQKTLRNNNERLLRQRSTSRRRPLVVFPALPVSPLPVFDSKPLRWFILPLFRRIDNYKRQVAKQFPGEVLFVDAPTEESFTEVEEGRGKLWDDRRAERILLRLTDISEKTRKRVEVLMQEHYEKWEKRRANDSADQRQTPEERHHAVDMKPYHRPGSSLISVDGVHPNSVGYEFWGRHIALGILEEWKKQDNY